MVYFCRVNKLMGKPTLSFWDKIGILSALVAAIADILLLYSPGGNYELGYNFLKEIPEERVLWGHWLGFLFIPTQLLATQRIYENILDKNLKKLLLMLSFLMVVAGTAYHLSIGQIQQYILSQADISESYLKLIKPIEALVPVLLIIISVAVGWAIYQKQTRYKRWLIFFLPVFGYSGCLLWYILLPVVGNALIAAGFNLSMALFYIASYYAETPNARAS